MNTSTTETRTHLRSEISSHRSFLFVPATRAERFAKALGSGADAVIVDLEDAVPPDQKALARQKLWEWLSPDRPVYVRVNANGTPWFEDDAQLCKHRGVIGVVLPKTEKAADICALASITKRRMPIFPLVESAAGLFNALEIAKAPFVQRLMFGTLDFCVDTSIASDGGELNAFRGQLSVISRVAGIGAPIDGVTPTLDDDARLEADVLNAKRWGFFGKLCIHPRQVNVVARSFSPGDAEQGWAVRVLSAFENANGAAVAVDGKMVDRPVVLHAQSILAERMRRKLAVSESAE